MVEHFIFRAAIFYRKSRLIRVNRDMNRVLTIQKKHNSIALTTASGESSYVDSPDFGGRRNINDKNYANLKVRRFSLSLSLSLSLKHLCYEIKTNNFITSTAFLTDKLLSSKFDPELKEFLSKLCENLKTKDDCEMRNNFDCEMRLKTSVKK